MTPGSLTRAVIKEVADKHGFTPACLRNDCQIADLTIARQEAFHRLRYERNLSLSQIGRLFNRHHTTVLNGLKTHAARSTVAAAA